MQTSRLPGACRAIQSAARASPAGLVGNCPFDSIAPVAAATTARLWVAACVSTPITYSNSCATTAIGSSLLRSPTRSVPVLGKTFRGGSLRSHAHPLRAGRTSFYQAIATDGSAPTPRRGQVRRKTQEVLVRKLKSHAPRGRSQPASRPQASQKPLETLLCLESSGEGVKLAEDLARDVALEAAADLASCSALGGAALDVGAGGGVVGHADPGDDVQGAVELAVPTAGEAVADGVARGGGEWCCAGQGGERGFGADAPAVGPRGQHDSPGNRAQARDLEQTGHELADVHLQGLVVALQVDVHGQHCLGQAAGFAADRGCGGIVAGTGTSGRDLLKLCLGQSPAGVDTQLVGAQQDRQRVAVGGAPPVDALARG